RLRRRRCARRAGRGGAVRVAREDRLGARARRARGPPSRRAGDGRGPARGGPLAIGRKRYAPCFVSPDQGRRGTSGKGGGGASGALAARPLGLAVFGIAFVVLFAIVAIAEGIGDPSVPSGSVALVENTPGDVGDVTQARFDHALELAAKQGGEKKVPKPGEPKYEELKETALNAIFEAIWLQGLAAEEGIEVTDEELAKEREKLKNENFKTEAEFNEFLKSSGFTSEDINERVRLQILSGKLQERLKEKAPQPSQSEIE